MNKEVQIFEKIQSCLFDDSDKVSLSPMELEIKKRYMAAYSCWLENPSYTDKQIVNFLVNNLNISKSQAYRDIPRIKILLGNIKSASKEWYRYIVVQGLLESIARAKKKGDEKNVGYLYDKLGKYTKLDKEDIEEMPWNEIIPPAFEPSPDPTLMEAKYISEEKRMQIRKKYKSSDTVEDAVIID